MRIYILFLINKFINSFFYVLAIICILGFILNLFNELEYFREIEVNQFLPFFLSLIDTPSLIFEILPFIFLVSTQLFFVKLLDDNQLNIFKYSGLKNSKILTTISTITLIIGLIVITLFYNISSNLKDFYLNIKKNYSSDGKYLAVVTKNGLWIKDIIDNKILIINADEIQDEYLINSYISEFNENFDIIKSFKSEKIDISSKQWKASNNYVFEKYTSYEKDILVFKTNYDYNVIQSLFSNLSALSLKELFILKKNYKKLNYSQVEINIQILKILTYPIFLLLIVILSSIIMFNSRSLKSTTFKISIGLFLSVIIYYINNFFIVMGKTEKLSYIYAITLPLLILVIINLFYLRNINEK